MNIQLASVLLFFHLVFAEEFGLKTSTKSAPDQVCDDRQVPNKRIVCYYRVEETFRPYDLDPCLCTHIIYSYVAIKENFAFVAGKKGDLKFLSSLKKLNPRLKTLVSLRPSNKRFSLEAITKRNISATAVRTKFARQVREFLERHALDGVDLDWEYFREIDRHQHKRETLNTILRILKNVFRSSAVSNGIKETTPYLITVTTTKFPKDLADNYDITNFYKLIDFINLPAFNFDTQGKTVKHPAKLHSISDMESLDSMIDLVLALGLPQEQLTIGVPAHGVYYKLANVSQNEPGSTAIPWNNTDAIISHSKICSIRDNSNWTMVREKDLTAPYIFNKDKWIGFDDEISLKLKTKYMVLRQLGGIAIWSVNDDDPSGKCGYGPYPLLQSIRSVLLQSVEEVNYIQEPLMNSTDYYNNTNTKTTSFVAVIEKYGNVERIETEEQLPCPRFGYIKHPQDCTKFYRCIKFDQNNEQLEVFQYNCPVGLVFDERYEICNWPSWSPSCPGSAEIMTASKKRFSCPSYGYFQDPENCEYFYYCSDFGKSFLQAYEFKCPFELGFDEDKLLCNWKWLVRGCKNVNKANFAKNLPQSFIEQANINLNSPNLELDTNQDEFNERSDVEPLVKSDVQSVSSSETNEKNNFYNGNLLGWVGGIGSRIKSFFDSSSMEPRLDSFRNSWIYQWNPFAKPPKFQLQSETRRRPQNKYPRNPEVNLPMGNLNFDPLISIPIIEIRPSPSSIVNRPKKTDAKRKQKLPNFSTSRPNQESLKIESQRIYFPTIKLSSTTIRPSKSPEVIPIPILTLKDKQKETDMPQSSQMKLNEKTRHREVDGRLPTSRPNGGWQNSHQQDFKTSYGQPENRPRLQDSFINQAVKSHVIPSKIPIRLTAEESGRQPSTGIKQDVKVIVKPVHPTKQTPIKNRQPATKMPYEDRHKLVNRVPSFEVKPFNIDDFDLNQFNIESFLQSPIIDGNKEFGIGMENRPHGININPQNIRQLKNNIRPQNFHMSQVQNAQQHFHHDTVKLKNQKIPEIKQPANRHNIHFQNPKVQENLQLPVKHQHPRQPVNNQFAIRPPLNHDNKRHHDSITTFGSENRPIFSPIFDQTMLKEQWHSTTNQHKNGLSNKPEVKTIVHNGMQLPQVNEGIRYKITNSPPLINEQIPVNNEKKKSSLLIIPVPDDHPKALKLPDVERLANQYPQLFPEGLKKTKVTSLNYQTSTPGIETTSKTPSPLNKQESSDDYIMLMINNEKHFLGKKNGTYGYQDNLQELLQKKDNKLYSLETPNTQTLVALIPKDNNFKTTTPQPIVYEPVKTNKFSVVTKSPVVIQLEITPGKDDVIKNIMQKVKGSVSVTTYSPVAINTQQAAEVNSKQTLPPSLYNSIQQMIAKQLSQNPYSISKNNEVKDNSIRPPLTSVPATVSDLPNTYTTIPTTLTMSASSSQVSMEQLPIYGNNYNHYYNPNETFPSWHYQMPWYHQLPFPSYYQPVYPPTQKPSNQTSQFQYYPLPPGYAYQPSQGYHPQFLSGNLTSYQWYDWMRNPSDNKMSATSSTVDNSDDSKTHKNVDSHYITKSSDLVTTASTVEWKEKTVESSTSATEIPITEKPGKPVASTPIYGQRNKPTELPNMNLEKPESPQIQVYIVQGTNGSPPQVVESKDKKDQTEVKFIFIDGVKKEEIENQGNSQNKDLKNSQEFSKTANYYNFDYNTEASVKSSVQIDEEYLKNDERNYHKDIEYEDESTSEQFESDYLSVRQNPVNPLIPATKIQSLQHLYNSNIYHGLRNFTDGSVPESACTRPGLFQHPNDCNKYYECYWDKYINKFTLHLFECPVKLAFDSRIVGCNAPSDPTVCVQY